MDKKAEMIPNSAGIMNSGRKRGHQHHIRNSGTRRSNVPATEVIAALRSGGDHIPVTPNICEADEDDNKNQNRHRNPNRDSTYLSDTELNLTVDTDNNLVNRNLFSDDNNLLNRPHNNGVGELIKKSSTNNKTTDNNCMDKGTLINENNRLDSMAATKRRMPSILNDSTNDQVRMEGMDGSSNAIVSDLIESSKNLMSTSQLSATSSDFDMESSVKDDLDDSISSSSSSSKLKKSKSKKSRTPDTNRSERKREKRSKARPIPPSGVRPPLEGSDERRFDFDEMGDIENDPDAAEWSKLRCTSERTEVVAEREYRRQNRRCADYPGLAFGRSIFSSDTMMKFNIIRNELHNIMKTQLKRVRVHCTVKYG